MVKKRVALSQLLRPFPGWFSASFPQLSSTFGRGKKSIVRFEESKNALSEVVIFNQSRNIDVVGVTVDIWRISPLLLGVRVPAETCSFPQNLVVFRRPGVRQQQEENTPCVPGLIAAPYRADWGLKAGKVQLDHGREFPVWAYKTPVLSLRCIYQALVVGKNKCNGHFKWSDKPLNVSGQF